MTMNIVPPREDCLPLCYFIALMLAFNLSAFWMPSWGRAAYGAWLAVGVAYVVHADVEPGLPRTFWANLRRVLRGHIWPLYVRGH